MRTYTFIVFFFFRQFFFFRDLSSFFLLCFKMIRTFANLHKPLGILQRSSCFKDQIYATLNDVKVKKEEGRSKLCRRLCIISRFPGCQALFLSLLSFSFLRFLPSFLLLFFLFVPSCPMADGGKGAVREPKNPVHQNAILGGKRKIGG